MKLFNRNQILFLALCLVIACYLIGFISQNSLTGGFNVSYAQDYTIREEHPRIFLIPEKLARLRELKNRNTKEWQNLLKLANRSVYNNWFDWYTGPATALVYQILKDSDPVTAQTYADKTKQIMAGRAQIPSLAGNDYRNGATWFPLMYDWVYDQLNATEKQTYYEAMNRWVDSEIPMIGMPPNCIRQSDTDQLLADLQGFLLSGITSYPENPRAEELISLAEGDCRGGRVAYWINQTKGGLWPAGTKYNEGDLMYLMTFIAPAYKSAMNRDYWQEIGNPDYPKEQLLAHLNIILPGGKYMLPYGDIEGAGEYLGLGSYDVMFVALTEQLAGTPEGEYAQWAFNHLLGRYDIFYYMHFIFYDPDRPEKDYRGQISTTYLASGMTFTFSRSDWSDNASYIALQSQWEGGFADHHNTDAGSFQILRKGVWLTKEDTGYVENHTHNHSTYLINEENKYVFGRFAVSGGQSQSGPFTGGITKLDSQNDYTFMVGDFSGAYTIGPAYCELACANGNPAIFERINDNWHWYYEPIKQAVRTIVHLKPDYFVIFDQVETNLPDLSKQYLFHSYEEPVISGNLITSSHTGNNQVIQKLFTKVLLPENPIINKYDENIFYPRCGECDAERNWQIKIKPSSEQNRDYFLTVLEGADESKSNMISTTKLESQEGTALGAQIGDRVVMFAKLGQIDGSLTYTLSGSGLSKQLVLNLRPNHPYNIYDNGNDIGTFSSSDQGTLTFDINLSSDHTISIIPQNIPVIKLTKQVDRQSATQGEILTYTLGYQNTGSLEAINAILEDPIPSGTSYVNGSATGEATFDGSKIILNIRNLAPGASGSVQFQVKIE